VYKRRGDPDVGARRRVLGARAKGRLADAPQHAPQASEFSTFAEYLGTTWSFPTWVVARLLERFPDEDPGRMLSAMNRRPALCVRVNTRRASVAEAEAAQFENRTLEANNRDRRGSTPEADVGQAYNEAWFERGTKLFPSRRTSIVIDPPDGRVPPLTPQAQQAAADRAQVQRLVPNGPEDLSLPVRCILWPTAVPPNPHAFCELPFIAASAPQPVRPTCCPASPGNA